MEHAVAIDVHEHNCAVDLCDCKPTPPTTPRICVDAGTQCSMTSADVLGEARETKFMLSPMVQPTSRAELVVARAEFDSTRTQLSLAEVRLLVQICALLHHPLMGPQVQELTRLIQSCGHPTQEFMFQGYR